MDRASKACWISIIIVAVIIGLLGLGQGVFIDYYFTNYEKPTDQSNISYLDPIGKKYVFEGTAGTHTEKELEFIQDGERLIFTIDPGLNCIPSPEKDIKIIAYQSKTFTERSWHIKRVIGGC